MWLLFSPHLSSCLIIWFLYSNSSVHYEQVGGNYAAAILPAQIAAQKHGCAQVLYMSYRCAVQLLCIFRVVVLRILQWNRIVIECVARTRSAA
jgi:hypothetical protein